METFKPKPVRYAWQGILLRFTPQIVCGVILLILPLFISSYLQTMVTKVLIFAILAMSLDVIFGYTGLLSLGHAAYFGVAGYTTGVLITRYGIESFWLSAPMGILAAGLVSAVFGLVALRVSGIYFLLVTFAIGELLFSVAMKWHSMTGGSDGLVGIPRPDFGIPFTWNDTSFYYFSFVALAICFFILKRLINSPFGQALQGIRENEPRMSAIGYNTWLYKYIAFVIAGLFAGVAGVLFAHFNRVMAPMHLGISTSALVMLMVIIGGTGTLFGSIIGSTVIIFVEHFSSIYTPERWPLILGAVFVISVMYFRKGIGVYLARPWEKALKVIGKRH